MQVFRFRTAVSTAAFFSVLLPACSGAAGDQGDPIDPHVAGSAFDVQRYDLRGEYDWTRGRLVASVDVTLTADPHLGSIVLDSDVTDVKAVHAGGAALPFMVDAPARKLAIDVHGLAGRGDGAPIVLRIDYEARSGRGLVALPVRAGDPVAARALYTESEPQGAHRWMPCHDRPDDRAVFSVELTMAGGESMIANGDLELDEQVGAAHRMRYATKYPLPTYLMAFAVSAFEVERGQEGDVPLAVWHRAGVPGDYGRLLGEIGREIDVFSGQLGPYPFEKYALVMLPEFSGGMENAGITFQSEIRSAEPSLSEDLGLSAHELGHQWFGDLVTVATWDDLWIKEGMATLLSAEAGRLYEDEGGAKTLLGDAFEPSDGYAVRDRSRAPGDKYTSGPYDRAAWLLTQIRAVSGEEAFWGTLRSVLDEHRFGVVGTDDLLAAFAPALGPGPSLRARRAVDAKALPRIEIAAAEAGGAIVTLHDPEGILVAPLSIAWHREDGTVHEEPIVPELPRELRREAAGDFLVIDPRDVHPSLLTFCADDATRARFEALVAPLRVPARAEEAPRFAELPGVHTRAALSSGTLPPIAPEALSSFIASLRSEAAKALSVYAACEASGTAESPTLRLEWISAVTGALGATPRYAGLGYVTSYDACDDLVDSVQLFSSDWAALAKAEEEATIPDPRLSFLSKFTLPPVVALAAWGDIVATSASPRARALAARRIRHQAARLPDGVPAVRAAWRAKVAELIGGSEVSSVLSPLVEAAVSLRGEAVTDDAATLDALGGVLRSPATLDVQAQVVCAAHALTAGDTAAFATFAERAAGGAISEDAAALLADPAACDG